MYIEYIIHTGIPGKVSCYFIGHINIGGHFRMKDKIFRDYGFAVIRSDIRIPAIALVRYAGAARSVGGGTRNAGITKALGGQLAPVSKVGTYGKFAAESIFQC